MGKCKVCGHRGVYFKHSFFCPVLDKKNPHITFEEELTDPCDCEYCRKHRGTKVRRKTQTRRLLGKSANYSVWRVYAIRDRWFSKPQGHILITRKFRQNLGDINCEDVKKEGYNSLQEFSRAWEEVNGHGSWDPQQIITAYEFKLLKEVRR